MKTLLLLRHGKAQADSSHGDKGRTLTERGEDDAATMGKKIKDLVGCLDVIVTSDAKRAKKTAKLAAEASGYKDKPTIEEAIYEADVATLLTVIHALPSAAKSALLVGHNPGFEELGARAAPSGAAIPHLPTAGLIHLEFAVTAWPDIEPGRGHLRGLYSPQD